MFRTLVSRILRVCAVSLPVGALAVGFATVLTPLGASSGFAQEIQSSIARGGKLYDKWYKVIGAEKPVTTHPAWPAANTRKKADATQRCKACHGWDLRGVDGTYGSGSYLTGIKGLTNLAGADPAVVIAAVQDDLHGFAGKMDAQDYIDLANFVTRGQFDMKSVINDETRAAIGDVAFGAAVYNTVCAACHGRDGELPKEMKLLGKLANGNPWEVIQKIMNGQPAEKMPAMRVFGVETAGSVLAYLQTLPVE
jgi:Cytochrome C oxidase, cbb3-type, subunit III